MAIREKATVTLRLEGSAVSHSHTSVSTRGLTTNIDEPIERGGTNLGLTPTETFAAALISCTNVISHKIAHRMGIDLKDVVLRLQADFDRRGVTLSEDVSVPFPSMTLYIDVTSDATPAQREQLQRELAMYCPIAKLVRASGTTLTEAWNWTSV